MKLTYILAPALLLLAGCSHSYRADQTPAPSKVLYIDSQLADCVGVAPMKCMKVKEKPNAEWEFFYQNIDGFTYEPGYLYRIAVKVTDIPNPPADAPSARYELLTVLDKDRK